MDDAATQNWLESIRTRVDARLRVFFERKRQEVHAVSSESAEILDAVESMTLRGGKRLRSTLVAGGYRAVAGKLDEAWVEVGCAIELLQTYFLIHDDWMDGDEWRRGARSAHAAFRESYGDAHLGASLGILAGDLAGTYGWELILQARYPASERSAALEAFARMQVHVIFGQHLDLVQSEDLARMHDLKTGSYTVRGPLVLGAHLGEPTDEALRALLRFADPLGRAFQLRDDLLGTFGQSETVGKSIGSDLRSGKRNALWHAARAVLSQPEWARFESLAQGQKASESDLEECARILVSSGARARVEAELEALSAEAEQALKSAPFDDEARALLRSLAVLFSERDR